MNSRSDPYRQWADETEAKWRARAQSDIPHQWVLDHLTALCLMGEMDKEEVERIHALFVQRFPDDLTMMKQRVETMQKALRYLSHIGGNFCVYPDKQIEHVGALVVRAVAQAALDVAAAQPDAAVTRDLEQQGENYITESAGESSIQG